MLRSFVRIVGISGFCGILVLPALVLAIAVSRASAQEPCPRAARFDVDGPSTDIDPGWTGMAHDNPYVSLAVTMAISGCPGSTQGSCGTCSLSGPLANGGGATFNNRRCVDETWLTCVTDSDCVAQGAVGPCHVFFGPPLPYTAGGVSTCVINEITGAGSGTIGVESGDVTMNLPYKASIYTGPTLAQPCPQCLSGMCSGGARNGMSCTASGTSALFGPVSFDCPPFAGSLVGTLIPSGLTLTTGTQTMTLTAANPNCRFGPFAGDKCLCDTCNNAAGTPCATDSDCVAVGASICGGKRCLVGTNFGAPCTAHSECPGGVCTVPGQATAPNQCDDGVCSPNPADTDSSNEGVCNGGPLEQFCAIDTYRGCLADGDCPAPGDTCTVAKLRECFTDNGTIGGSISATGVANPPAANEAAPTLVSLACLPPTSSSSVNVVAGFPGAGRLTLPSLLTLDDKTASGTAPPGGGTVTTDTESDGATPTDPLETTVTSPNGGEIILDEQAATGTPLGGFTFLGKQVNITAPAATAANPLVIVFQIDASRIPAGQNQNTIAVFKNGVPVPSCTGAGATPDPCVATRTLLGDGDVALTIRTSSASTWDFGTVVCPAAPDPGCRVPTLPRKASVQLKSNPDPSKDVAVWKWGKGQATTFAEFGDPTDTTTYALCIYDGSTLLTSAAVPPGGVCGGKPCWSAKALKSYKYRDKNLSVDGISQVLLNAGVDGKAKVQVKAKGANFPMPSLGALTLPVTVQLHDSSNAVCWTAQYSSPTKNDGTQFKAKSD